VDQLIAAVGAACILFAFWALSTQRMQGTDVRYQLINLVGAALLATAAFMTESWAFVVLNTVWALVAVWALVNRA
jgi:hypothetical protein